jgi:hypothetical protein
MTSQKNNDEKKPQNHNKLNKLKKVLTSKKCK